MIIVDSAHRLTHGRAVSLIWPQQSRALAYCLATPRRPRRSPSIYAIWTFRNSDGCTTLRCLHCAAMQLRLSSMRSTPTGLSRIVTRSRQQPRNRTWAHESTFAGRGSRRRRSDLARPIKARTAMQHAVIRAKRFIKSPSRFPKGLPTGWTHESGASSNLSGDWGIENDLFNPPSWETLLGRPAHEARIKLLHRAHAALPHGYARLVAYDLEHALDAFLAEGSQSP
jgi:hypothetical protein